MPPISNTQPGHVVIAGGGVAALEALIALRSLTGDVLQVTLLAAQPDFVYRPMAVAEPFCLGHATRHPLADIARDFGADLVLEPLVRVDPEAGEVVTGDGTTIAYDSLIVATGAPARPVFEHAITFGADGAPDALAGLLADLEQGYARRVAFVVPPDSTWTLPLYELALMTARDAFAAGMEGLEFVIVTPEPSPLAVFGDVPSRAVAALLAEVGVTFVGGVQPDVGHGEVRAGDRRIAVDRSVSLPVPVGPAIPGLPRDDSGFLPVDAHARVRGLDGVFAAGDVTDSPIKQGGLAAQQAVAAAEAVAARHGFDADPRPFRPVLRGMLLTAGQHEWLRAPVGDTPIGARATRHALWWPPTKIATQYLAPYLLGRDEARRLQEPPPDAGSTPAGALPSVALGPAGDDARIVHQPQHAIEGDRMA
jgi:sulfide:quinone oxidoreductase